MFIFNFGNAIGSMSMTPVGGVIFQQNPFGVIYFSTGTKFLHVLPVICFRFTLDLFLIKHFLIFTKVMRKDWSRFSV